MMDAAINGVVSGVTVAAGPLIEVGIGKAADFITTGLNNMGLSSVVDGLSVAARTAGNAIDDVANLSGISKITGALDDVTNSAAKSIDDVLGTGAKSGSKAGGALVGGADDLSKGTGKVDDIEIQGLKSKAREAGFDIDSHTPKELLNKLDEYSNKSILSAGEKDIKNGIFATLKESPEYTTFATNSIKEQSLKMINDKEVVNAIDNWSSISTVEKKAALQKISDIQSEFNNIPKKDLQYYSKLPEDGKISNGYYNGKMSI